jgi:hypothetical protein
MVFGGIRRKWAFFADFKESAQKLFFARRAKKTVNPAK